VPGQLQAAAKEPLDSIAELLARESFFDEGPAIATHAAAIDCLVATAIQGMTDQQERVLREAGDRWTSSSDWLDVEPKDREWAQNELSQLRKAFPQSLEGLRELLGHHYTVTHALGDIEETLRKKAAQSRVPPPVIDDTDGVPPVGNDEIVDKPLVIPTSIEKKEDLEILIAELQKFLKSINAGQKIRVNCQIRQLDAGHSTKAGT
jgi:hypothetical protein